MKRGEHIQYIKSQYRREVINECGNEITKLYLEFANTPLEQRATTDKWLGIARDRIEKLK